MMSNFFRIAIRKLRRQKLYAAINILGLSTGLAGSLLIGWYVTDELSYDDFHKDAEQLYRVTTHWGDDPKTNIYATTPPPLRDRIREEIPEVRQVARAFSWNHSTMRLPKSNGGQDSEVVFRETNIFIVDPNFLQVMDFNLISGDATTALQDLESIVLSRETALRYFGAAALEKDEVIGKTILFGGSQSPRRVTAVVDPPPQTHLPFDMLVNVQYGYREIANSENWAWNIMHTYLKVDNTVVSNQNQYELLETKIQQLADRYGKPYMQQSKFGDASPNQTYNFRLQPVTDIHLHSQYLREHVPNGNLSTVYSLSAIGLLIVALACINFMNLATAQSTQRAKEVGVRKVLGSSRYQLAGQYLAESLLLTLIALLLALGLLEITREPFNILSGKDLQFNWWAHKEMLMIALGLVFFTGLAAGSYPAIYLTAFHPADVLKNQISRKGKPTGRYGLVTFQFTIAITLISCTLLVVEQLRYMQNKHPGFQEDNVLVIQNDREVQEKWESFKQALEAQPQVQSVSFTTGLPAQPLRHMRDFRAEGAKQGQGIRWVLTDEDFAHTLELDVLQGRSFSEDRSSDQHSLLLNEAAIQLLGLKDAVGTMIIKNQGAEDEERLEVIGIVKDFHIESFQQEVKPLAFQYFRPGVFSDFIAVRLHSGMLSASIRQVEEIWKKFEPANPFVYSFLDQDFDALFRAEQRLGKVLTLFTGLALVIACLGLVALAAFVAERRTKEIGLRKVMGASSGAILSLLSSGFFKITLVASAIALPLSYLLMRKWLQHFAYQTDINFWVLILACGGAFLLAAITVSFQTIKAALSNPVDALRNE